MISGDELLFNKYDLRKVIESQGNKLQEEIDRYDRDYILNVSVDDLCVHLEDKYKIATIVFHKDKIYIKQHGDAQIDVSHDYNRVIFERDKPFFIKGTAVTFSVPFDGDSELFYCQASSFTLSPPRASIVDGEVLVNFQEVDPNPDKIKKEFERRLADIERQVGHVNNDLRPFNDSLRSSIIQKINGRKDKLLKDHGMVAALGYPMREASDVPKTYAVPSVQRKIPVQRPQATSAPFVPEPVLDMENYETIIRIISDMVLVIERSPHVFKDIKEEDLRQHFLVQLNGQYQGTATGETFNFTGKTDILIRENGKNIFISECMFWKGAKSLIDKIDQMMGYLSWRDTKTAILIFNKNREFSKMLEQIPETVKQYKNFKRQIDYKHESGYRFVLHQTGDKNRELILTVLAFDIPTDSKNNAEVDS